MSCINLKVGWFSPSLPLFFPCFPLKDPFAMNLALSPSSFTTPPFYNTNAMLGDFSSASTDEEFVKLLFRYPHLKKWSLFQADSVISILHAEGFLPTVHHTRFHTNDRLWYLSFHTSEGWSSYLLRHLASGIPFWDAREYEEL